MFTDKAQKIIDMARDHAFSQGSAELTPKSLLAAFGKQSEASVLLAQAVGLSIEKLRADCPEYGSPAACPGKLPVAETTHAVLTCGQEMANEIPDSQHPGLVSLRHLACAMAISRDACAPLGTTRMTREDALALLAVWYQQDATSPELSDLVEKLRRMRVELLQRVFGQDHAVHTFVEGLFNAEVVASADVERKSPRSVFVFAGPPGVGKTFLAELGASGLERPFKRFDMSGYSGHQQNDALVGMGRSYRGAHPGQLTEFVEKNPHGVLLFDEIEKSHSNTIHLFLQVLDAGVLEDKYHERNVSFRETTIIFTTNAGRRLYERPNESGVLGANMAFHRQTVLDALATEKNPLTGEPFFPQALCSRLATGYPVLFNHLRVNELERIVRAEFLRTANLVERQHYKRISYHDLLPICLVLREGARADARTLRSQAETFVKSELFKFCQLFETDRLEDVMEQIESIHFEAEQEHGSVDPEVQGLFGLLPIA